jgi:hypothetical protein
MSSTGTSENSSYQRQPAPGQEIDPKNPPIAQQGPGHADDPDKVQGDDSGRDATPCDYVDVVRLAGGQPRFLLQPHLSGGAMAMGAFTLEVEGARALVQHLQHVLLE